MGGSHCKNGRLKYPKKVRNGKFHNTRPVGKPRTRYEGVFRSDTSQKTEKNGEVF